MADADMTIADAAGADAVDPADAEAPEVRLRLLGPVEIDVGGTAVPLSGLRRKSVVAVLGLHPGQILGVDRLIRLVWGHRAPATARNTLQQHVSHVRDLIGVAGVIVARTPGYQLDLPATATDVAVARNLVARAAATGDDVERVGFLTRALGMWRGESLLDASGSGWLRDQGAQLDALRLDTVEALFEARLALGHHTSLTTELERLAAHHPLREALHRLLMLALYRSGRQADALSAYRRLRAAMAEEVGLDPSPALRELEAAILRQDDALEPGPRGPRPSGVSASRVVPAQLPLATPAFTGRERELKQLDELLAMGADRPRPQAVTVSALWGTAGVGKTALAVRWAHDVAEHFPDGQLYVDLRGFDPGGQPMDPAEAIQRFLADMGVARDQIPGSADGQLALYRSVLATKRVLILADNAHDEAQVRALLPGAPGCLVIVTSRHRLRGLVAAEGAVPLTLDLPTTAEAVEMLTRRLGGARIDAEPDAVHDLIELCARLPLALAIVAARAATEPATSLRALVAQLHGEPSTLDLFDGPDAATDVRAVLSWSYRALSAPAARLFRLLGPCPGLDIAAPAAASLAGVPPRQVRALLAELTRAHMLTESTPGRYRTHDLLCAYAREQAHRTDDPAQLAEAHHRVTSHYLHTAYAGGRAVKPARDPIALAGPAPGVTPEPFADGGHAMAWFAAEHAVLLALVVGQRDGLDEHVWQLAWILAPVLNRRGLRRDNLLVQQAGLAAAQRLDDPYAQAQIHRALGLLRQSVGDNESVHHFRQAARLFEQAGGRLCSANAHGAWAEIALQRQDFPEALRHQEHARQAFAAEGFRSGYAYASNNVGYYHGLLGNYAQGLGYCQQALEIFSELGDLAAAAATWDSLGYLYFRLGDRARGVAGYQHAIDILDRLGDRHEKAMAYRSLGDAHEHTGDLDAARQAWGRSLSILSQIEHPAAADLRVRLALA